MDELACSFQPKELAVMAFSLYECFRSAIPEGMGGWGAKGELDLSAIRSLANKGAG